MFLIRSVTEDHLLLTTIYSIIPVHRMQERFFKFYLYWLFFCIRKNLPKLTPMTAAAIINIYFIVNPINAVKSSMLMPSIDYSINPRNRHYSLFIFYEQVLSQHHSSPIRILPSKPSCDIENRKFHI